MILGHLKRDKQYLVPGTTVRWRLSRHRLYLSAELDLSKCTSLTLPPTEIGHCHEWRSVRMGNDNSLFTASWDLRRTNLDALDAVSAVLAAHA